MKRKPKLQTMAGTLPAVRKRLGLKLAELGDVARCSPSTVLNKLRGEKRWYTTESHRITVYLQETYGEDVTMHELFGLGDV